MAKELILEYDHEGDILEAFSEENAVTIAQDIGDDVWLKIDANTGAPLGFIILNLTKRSVKLPVFLQRPTTPWPLRPVSKPGEEYLLVNSPN